MAPGHQPMAALPSPFRPRMLPPPLVTGVGGLQTKLMKRKPTEHEPCRGYTATPCSACLALPKALLLHHGAQEDGPLPQQQPYLPLLHLRSQHQWRFRSAHQLFGSLYPSRSRASLVRTTRKFRQTSPRSGPERIARIIPITELSITRTATEANLERPPGRIAWIIPTGTITTPTSHNLRAPVCLTIRQDTQRAYIPLRTTWSPTHTESRGLRPVAAPDRADVAATSPRRRQTSYGPGSTHICTTLIPRRMRSSSSCARLDFR